MQGFGSKTHVQFGLKRKERRDLATDQLGTPGFGTGNRAGVAVAGQEYPFVLSINCASGIFDNEASETSGAGYSNAAAAVTGS